MKYQYNFTCHIQKNQASELETFLKNTIKPKLMEWGGIQTCEIFKIKMEVDDEVNSYSVQMNFVQENYLQQFESNIETALKNSFTQKFGQNIFTFSTVLSEL